MTLDEKIKHLHAIKCELEELSKKKKEIESMISERNAIVKAESDGLLSELDGLELESYEVDGLVAYTAVNTTNGYTNEAGALKYLSDNGYDSFIKVERSIKKKELNAELKSNAELKEGLKEFMVPVVTRYATVSTAENNAKRLEHVNEGRKGSGK